MATRVKKRDRLEWVQIVGDQERSGLSLRQYASKHGLNLNTLQWWRSKVRKAKEASGFVEVRPPEVAHAEVTLEVNQIRISGAVSVDQLRAVVSGLGC